MSLKEEIAEVFKQYLQAIFTKDYQTVYNFLFKPDVEHHCRMIKEFAHKMDEFGETDEFLKKVGFENLGALDALSNYELITSMLKLFETAVKPEHLKKILSETIITQVIDTPQCSEVHYELPVLFFDEWEVQQGQAQMVKQGNDWKLFYKSGMEAGLRRFQDEIDQYIERKSKDQLENLGEEDDLVKFSITGYRNYMTGKVVFEPRFKEAGDFSNGLAYVKIMRKYGYINLSGDLVIKPQYYLAKDFSEQLAAVEVTGDEESQKWGFIDTMGKMAIPPTYSNTHMFSEGLCGVQIGDKWGYINTEGILVIPAKFDVVNEFDEGFAYVDIYGEDGDAIELMVDKNGKIEKLS